MSPSSTCSPTSRPSQSFISLNNLANACSLAFSSWEEWRIWRRRSHVTVKHLLSNLMAIPIVHLLLNNLASAVSTRFEQLGGMEDLEEAITCHRQALALRPHGHPNRSSSLNNLANAVFTRFQQLGGMEDLEEAITCHRQALALRPHGHPNRSSSLNNLANAVSLAFSSWEEWRIWRRRSHVTVKHLLSDLMAIPIVHLPSITLLMLCPLAFSSWDEWRIWRRHHMSPSSTCSPTSWPSQSFILSQ
jgi:hypothetical protein